MNEEAIYTEEDLECASSIAQNKICMVRYTARINALREARALSRRYLKDLDRLIKREESWWESIK